MKTAVRLFLDGPPLPVTLLGCQLGYWDLATEHVKKIGGDAGVDVDCANDFTIIFSTIRGISGEDTKQVLHWMGHRLANLRRKCNCDPELFEIEAAVEVLEKTDEAKVTQEQEAAASRETHRLGFERQWIMKMQEVRSGEKKKRKKLPTLKIPTEITQLEAKLLLPPGATIWMGHKNETWNGHMPPFARLSARWCAYGGSKAAAKEVIGRLWLEYLFFGGPR